MERNRDGRRMAAANGLSRRRQRSTSLRDSPEEDGGGGGGGGAVVEMQETTAVAVAAAAASRLRDRGGSKKDRDRDRMSRSKRRRGERMIHGSNRGEEGEDSTEDSLDDDEDDDDEDAAAASTTATGIGGGGGGGSGQVRMLPPNPPLPSTSSSISNHHHSNHGHNLNNHHQHQHHHHNRHKSFPPPSKLMRAPPVLKAADEMIGVSVPRKARSASVKRTHETWNPSGSSGGGGGSVGGEQIHRQASTSPGRPSTTTAPSSSPAPISPPSHTSSVKKKMKSLGGSGGGGGGGPKQRPPKMAKPSSDQDDIEIEVAEVLYGLMRQSHCSSKQDFAPQKPDWKDTNGSSSDVKSRISSPTSNSPSTGPQSVMLAQNSNSSTTPSATLAPKRKRPRPVKPEEESPVNYEPKNSSTTSASKIGIDQSAKADVSSPKNADLKREDGGVSSEMGSSQVALAASEVPQMDPESGKPESESKMDSKALTDELGSKDEEFQLPKNESSTCKIEANSDDAGVTKSASVAVEVEGDRNEKFKIDLMVPPPSKPSPDRDCSADFVSDPKPVIPNVEMEKKVDVKDEERVERKIKQDNEDAPSVEKKAAEVAVEDLDSQKKRGNDVRVHLDLEQDLDRGLSNGSEVKQPQIENQQQSKTAVRNVRNESKADKSARYPSLPLPMTLAGWPGGLPPLGFAGQVPPIPGVMPIDGNSGSSNVIQQPHFLPPLRRPKCATHYQIAKTIYYHQQFARMNPFFAASAGAAASVYGTKPPYNLNILPQTENAIMGSPLPGIFPFSNSLPDKNKVANSLSGHNAKDKSSVTASFMDGAQTKQLVLQQTSQPANASNLMHAPAYIFPLSQQQAAAATHSMPGKSASSVNPTSLMASSPASGAQGKNSMATATSMSFSYPNLPNEAQYLAVLQNNGYPFPVPSHVGAPPPYRGGNAQAVPFFNGSFYSSQMLHPSQLQQQQPHSQQQPGEQGHQNLSTSSGSSSSQKHQQQRVHTGFANNGGAGSAHIPPKNRSQPQHNQSIPLPHNVRQLEAEAGAGGEESPSTADSRVSHLHKNIYCQNFTLPIHPQNFALMSPAALAGSVSGNAGEKPQQSQQQQGMKGGVELIPSQAFAMSFAFNGGAPAIAPGIDFSSMAQNHAILQGLPEAGRREYQIAAASQAVHQNKTHQISEEGKTGESSAHDEEKKAKDAKGHQNVGQTLVFSRPDSSEHPSSLAVLGNPVIDGSSRTLNLISPVNGNRPNSAGISSVSSAATIPVSTMPQPHQQLFIQLQKQQQQLQQQQQQQQQQLQQQQQQQQLAASSVPRPKQSGATNANTYPDRLPVSSAMSAKLPNTISVFPQAMMQGSNPAQNPQWKQSARAMTSSTSSLAPANSSLKNLSQHQSRTQQGLSQISFGVSPKAATSQHGQPLSTSNNPSPSPPMAVGSPASASKSAGGSPRTTTSSGSKVGQVGPSPSLSSQQPSKSSQSGPSSKSSPVGGRSVPSILGNAHVTTNSSSGAKAQSQQQIQQQQLQKQSLQQAQLFFSSPYMQAQSLSSSVAATSSISAGFYNQRRPPEQQQQHQANASAAVSAGLLGPPLALTSASTADPTKAIPASAGANNMKGVLPLHTAQFAAHTAGGNSHPLMSTPFSYMHSVPAVPVKPTEHKKPAA